MLIGINDYLICLETTHNTKESSRIIGGKKASKFPEQIVIEIDDHGTIKEHRDSIPWQVAFFNEEGVIDGGGVLLSNEHVLTAAHCHTRDAYFTQVHCGAFLGKSIPLTFSKVAFAAFYFVKCKLTFLQSAFCRLFLTLSEM